MMHPSQVLVLVAFLSFASAAPINNQNHFLAVEEANSFSHTTNSNIYSENHSVSTVIPIENMDKWSGWNTFSPSNSTDFFTQDTLHNINQTTPVDAHAITFEMVYCFFFFGVASIMLLVALILQLLRLLNEMRIRRNDPLSKVCQLPERFVHFAADPLNLAPVYARIYVTPPVIYKELDTIIEEDLDMIV